MQRAAIAVGAVAVVAAALLGYYLIGGDGQEPAIVAESPSTAAPTDSTAAPPPPPIPSDTAGQPDTAATAESAAGESAPVVEVRPRTPAAASDAVAVPAEAPAGEAPTFDVVRVERSGETVIAGRAAPDSEVNVTTQDGTSLGRARADSSGSWAIVAEQPLAPGSHEIGIAAEGAEGAQRLSEDVVVVVVPEARPAPVPAPAETPAATEEQVLAVLTPRQGGASRVLPQEAEDGIAEGDLVLDSVDYDEAGQAVIGGRAAPGSRVQVYLDNRVLGDTVAGDDGRWSLAPEDPVVEGMHALRVDQVDQGGEVIARVETPFSRQAVRVAQDNEEFVIVQPGNSLWRIARRTYGQGLQYSVIYQANRDQIRDPDLIYPGQVFELPRTN
ncbi:MAG: LysM peptidoglycan-binding domain-containing protein [Kiloniellaceae bacterium]